MTSLASAVGSTASIVARVSRHHRGDGQETGPLAYLGGSDAHVGRQSLAVKAPGDREWCVPLGYIAVELYTVSSVGLSLEPKWSNVRQNLNPAKSLWGGSKKFC